MPTPSSQCPAPRPRPRSRRRQWPSDISGRSLPSPPNGHGPLRTLRLPERLLPTSAGRPGARHLGLPLAVGHHRVPARLCNSPPGGVRRRPDLLLVALRRPTPRTPPLPWATGSTRLGRRPSVELHPTRFSTWPRSAIDTWAAAHSHARGPSIPARRPFTGGRPGARLPLDRADGHRRRFVARAAALARAARPRRRHPGAALAARRHHLRRLAAHREPDPRLGDPLGLGQLQARPRRDARRRTHRPHPRTGARVADPQGRARRSPVGDADHAGVVRRRPTERPLHARWDDPTTASRSSGRGST